MRKDAGLPEGWEKCCIRDIAEVIVSPVDKHSLENEEKVLLCNYTDIYYNSNITQDMCFMEATASYNEIKKFSLRVDDVVITKDSETPEDIGVPAYVASVKENLLCGYHLAILRPKKRTDGKFLMYALMNKKVANDFYRYSNGITRFGLTSDAYNKVRMLMPPLGEQKAIADVLSKWDEAIEITERLIKAKEKRFRWLLRTLIGDQCEKSGWKKVNLGEIFNVFTHSSKSQYVSDNGERYIVDMGSVSRDSRLIPSKKTDLDIDLLNIGDLIMPKDDIGGGNIIGKVAIIEEEEKYVCGDHVYRLSQKTRHDVSFLYFLINSRFVNNQLRRKAKGTSQIGLSKPDLLGQELSIPPLNRQKKIATILNSAQQEVGILKELVEKYRIQKRGLMQKLLTGKWRVKAKA